MQHSLSSLLPTSERLQQRFGFKLDKRVREFEVIAEAKSRGFKHEGSLEVVYEKSIEFLMEVIDEEEI